MLLEPLRPLRIQSRRFSIDGGWDLEVVGSEVPAGKVSGDLFESGESIEGQASIAMGDASGHGVAAGMLVVDVRRLLSLMASMPADPGSMMSDLNRHVMKRFPTCRFVTLTLLSIDQATRRLRYATAGQPFYRVSPGGVVTDCDSSNGPVGIFDDEAFETLDLPPLEEGELLILISDGFREALNADRQMYSEDRLKSRIAENCGLSSEAIIEAIHQDVHEFKAGHGEHDDMTIVIVRLAPKSLAACAG